MPDVPDGTPTTTAEPAQSPAPATPTPRVIAVVVTYNRRDLLLEALAAVQAQTRPADAVIVIDNASTDGTAAAVRRQYPTAGVTELASNTGGAGGFACGMALALDQSADLVWLMDDDTVPEPGALRALLDARARYPAYPSSPPAPLARPGVGTDGRAPPLKPPRAPPPTRPAPRPCLPAAWCGPTDAPPR